MSLSRNSRREFLQRLAYLGGAAALLPQLRMIGTALASTSSLTGYKALVCIFLFGGNDSLLDSYCCDLRRRRSLGAL